MKCFNSCFYSRDLKRQNAKHKFDGRIPLGICFHAGADEEETTNSFKQIKSIGFDLVRVDFDWRRFQPLKRNEFDQEAINFFNFFINEAKRFKINVIIILSQTPEWASTLYNTGQVEEFTNAFKMYAKKIASLYGDYVEYYQYWNEANNFLTCKIKRSDWWKIFLAGDKGVREANTLLKPKGIVNWDNDSIYQFQWFSLLKTTFSKINEEDPIHTIRIIGIDLYPSTWSLTPSMGGWKFLDKVSMVVNDAKHPCYKFNLAITETGYSQLYKIPFTNKFKSRSEAEMAEWYKNNLTFLQNYMLKFNSSNYSKYLFITIYQLYDQNGHIVDPEAKFGLFKDDLKTPKAAVSIINVITLLAGVKSQEMNLIPWDSDAQSLYTVPQYLKSTQAKVASSVQNLMQVYCNGESKETYYGIQNPMQTAQKLIDDQGTLTNTKFQSSEMFFFLSLRDFHTNFVLPSPASCFSWIYPIGLDLASSNDLVKNPKVVVKTTRYYSFSNQPKGFSINAGDLVLSINGRTPVQLFQTFAPFAGGANNFGGMRAVLSLFDARSGEMYGPPASEFVTYVFQRPDGSQYTWTGSIFAYYDPQCVNSAPKVASENPEKDPVPKEKLNPYMGVTLDAILGWKFSKPLGFLDFKQTPDAVLGYNIYNFGKNKIGILQLASFIPNTGQNTFIQILISLLQNELSQTNALIIDVRNNGGGLVSLADFLPQIFGGKNIQPMRFRALATPINGNILSNWPDWAEAYQDAVAKKQKYTSKLLSFNSFEDANALGNYYHKPVGVWMNARCYSACDMFVANMKDNKVATIYGEDPQTGAGGANVIDLSFLSAYAPAAFQDSLPAGQTLRVAWRQAVRKNGKLIEDLGVEADVTIRPDPADFANTNSNRNLDKIITDLLSRNNIGIAGGEINFETTLPIKSTDWYGSNFQFSGFIKNVKTLKLAVDGEEVSKLTFNNITEKSNFFVADPQPSTTLGLKVYEVSGLDEESKTVFVQKRYFETLPLLEDFLEVINKNVAVNFAQKNKYSFISTKGNENVGWRLFENVLQLGSVNEKLTYSNKLDTKFKIFLHVQNYKEVNVILKVNGYFDIEYKNDFLNINIKYLTNDSDKTLSNRKVLLKQLTGKGDRIDDILISNLESEFFEISFEFKANEVGGGLEGPKIFDINFESVEKLVSEQDST